MVAERTKGSHLTTIHDRPAGVWNAGGALVAVTLKQTGSYAAGRFSGGTGEAWSWSSSLAGVIKVERLAGDQRGRREQDIVGVSASAKTAGTALHHQWQMPKSGWRCQDRLSGGRPDGRAPFSPPR